ncbi:MAG: ribose-phosphate pyrophosphokinase [Candidatus Woesearchaeota archaeon]|nr:ribose-phosphate pyrophosphokinase [Candidatus Woesearchaeota archaeon]
MAMKHKVKLLSGTANEPLAKEVAKELGMPLTPVTIKQFNDGEMYCRIEESVRGHTCFVFQSTSAPANDNLMELLILVDALKRASAKEINAVIPYYGYGRQDRKARSREPISAKLVANMLQAAGVDRVITFDLHVRQIQGFFDIPTDNLAVLPLMADYFLKKKLKNCVVVSPDVGGSVRARRLAELLNARIALVDKRRPRHGEAVVTNVVGDVKNKNAILLDDIIDSGGTITGAAKKIKELGAREVYVACSHPVFSKNAVRKLGIKAIKEVVVTNTIPVQKKAKNMKVISIGKLLAVSIKRIYTAEPMGVVFDKMYSSLKKKKK